MLKKFVSKEPVLKGWSGDKKYCLTDEQGNRFLLRVTPIEKYDEKMKEYELMHRVAEHGVPCAPRLNSAHAMKAFIPYKHGLTAKMRRR